MNLLKYAMAIATKTTTAVAVTMVCRLHISHANTIAKSAKCVCVCVCVWKRVSHEICQMFIQFVHVIHFMAFLAMIVKYDLFLFIQCCVHKINIVTNRRSADWQCDYIDMASLVRFDESCFRLLCGLANFERLWLYLFI